MIVGDPKLREIATCANVDHLHLGRPPAPHPPLRRQRDDPDGRPGGRRHVHGLHPQELAKCVLQGRRPARQERRHATTPTVWHDGTPIGELPTAPPPLKPEWTFDTPAGVAAFYKQPLKRKHLKTFCDAGSPGAIYAAERALPRGARLAARAAPGAVDGGGRRRRRRAARLLPDARPGCAARADGSRSSSAPSAPTCCAPPPPSTRTPRASTRTTPRARPTRPLSAAHVEGRLTRAAAASRCRRTTGQRRAVITDEREAVAALSEHGVSGVMDTTALSVARQRPGVRQAALAHARRREHLPALRRQHHNDVKDSIVSVRAPRRRGGRRLRAAHGRADLRVARRGVRRVPTILPVLDPAGSSPRSRGARQAAGCAARHCGLSCAAAAATLRPTSRRRRGRQSSLR